MLIKSKFEYCKRRAPFMCLCNVYLFIKYLRFRLRGWGISSNLWWGSAVLLFKSWPLTLFETNTSIGKCKGVHLRDVFVHKRWVVCCPALRILTLDLISDQLYLGGKYKGVLPRRCSLLWWLTLLIINSVTIKHAKAAIKWEYVWSQRTVLFHEGVNEVDGFYSYQLKFWLF